jgi:hypothetical protein
LLLAPLSLRRTSVQRALPPAPCGRELYGIIKQVGDDLLQSLGITGNWLHVGSNHGSKTHTLFHRPSDARYP